MKNFFFTPNKEFFIPAKKCRNTHDIEVLNVITKFINSKIVVKIIIL